MEPILLGDSPTGAPLYLEPEARFGTHMHIVGGSGTGKSKFLEWLMREDLYTGQGFCLLDWHGSLYNDILRYCAHQEVGDEYDYRKIILVNPSDPKRVTGFNPFMPTGGDVSVQVSRRVDATLRPWGVTDVNATPTFNRICRLLYAYMIEQGETLPNVAHLLQFKYQSARERVVQLVQDNIVRDEWEELHAIRKLEKWKEEVLSTKNRLFRFVGSKTVRRFMGLLDGNIDLMDIMDSGKILLVNLGFSDYLDRDAAKLFASLFLNEFFEVAMRRANRDPSGRKKSKPFVLYMDEFQEYITEDVSAMLDQVRKGGLHLVLAHQHFGHFEGNKKLQKSILANARIRAVFGGLDYEDATLLANEMFLSDLNTRQIKKAFYHTIHLYREEWREAFGAASGRSTSSFTSMGHSGSSGAGDSLTTPYPVQTVGWFDQQLDPSAAVASSYQGEVDSESYGDMSAESEVESHMRFPVFVPIPTQELTTEAEWSREEKVSKVVEMLKYQQQQHCFLKLPDQPTQPLRVPWVKDYGVGPERLLEYERETYRRQGARSSEEVDALLQANEQRFLGILPPPDIPPEEEPPDPWS